MTQCTYLQYSWSSSSIIDQMSKPIFAGALFGFYNSNLRHFLNFRMYVNIWKRRGEIKKKKLGKMLRRHAAKSFWMDENWVFELAILGVGTNLFLSWILLQKNRGNSSRELPLPGEYVPGLISELFWKKEEKLFDFLVLPFHFHLIKNFFVSFFPAFWFVEWEIRDQSLFKPW